MLLSSCKPDEVNCLVNNCLNGGKCSDGECLCPPGYSGQDCGQKIQDGGSQANNPSQVVVPTLSTKSASTITSSTTSSGGNITSDGGGSITVRGACWSTSQNPTIALSTKTNNGNGTGSFTSNLTGLSPNTVYYVRAYATNSAGTAYGNQVSFTTTPIPNPTDADGNTYTMVTIGTQVWMKENLKVSKYRNGDAIPTNLNNFQWQNPTSGAYSIYNNDPANNTTYGKLYNWYAVADPRGLCPAGWHVPSDAEWTTLENYLGGASVAGGKLKSTSTLWSTPNTGATNESGFSGLPGGSRHASFGNFGTSAFFWTATRIDNSQYAWARWLTYYDGVSIKYSFNQFEGFAVRCIKD